MSKQIKNYLVRHLYVHNWYETDTCVYTQHFEVDGRSYSRRATKAIRGDKNGYLSRDYVRDYPLPGISELQPIINQLKKSFLNNNAQDAYNILSKDYILAIDNKSHQREIKHADTLREEHREHFVHQQIEVRPVVEEFLLNDPKVFKDLLERNQEAENPEKFLNALKLIQLTDENEKIDFSEFNLNGASFNGAKLSHSSFFNAKTNHVDFTDCDLSKTDITQEQLDQSSTYYNAKLPIHMWKYWDDAIKKELTVKLNNLKSYAENTFTQDDKKYQTVMSLYNTYHPILTRSGNISSTEKQNMLTDFTAKSTQQVLNQHRSLKYLAAEVLSFVGLLAVGYLIAAGIRMYKTGHFGLLTETKSSAIARDLKESILLTSPVARR